MQSIVIPAMVVALIAAYPGWLMYQKAYYTSRRWWRVVTILFGLILPFFMAAVVFFIPFNVCAGTETHHAGMFTDFVLYAICPLAVIGLIAYVLDYMGDMQKPRPRRALAAGAACFAIAMLPTIYFFSAPQLFESYEIVVNEVAPQE